METTLRSVRRRVGHTHGWLRTLGKAEEEREGTEEGGGERRFQRLLWDSSRRSIELKKPMQILSLSPFWCFYYPTLGCVPLIYGRNPYGWEVHMIVTAHWKRIASIFIIRLMEQ